MLHWRREGEVDTSNASPPPLHTHHHHTRVTSLRVMRLLRLPVPGVKYGEILPHFRKESVLQSLHHEESGDVSVVPLFLMLNTRQTNRKVEHPGYRHK